MLVASCAAIICVIDYADCSDSKTPLAKTVTAESKAQGKNGQGSGEQRKTVKKVPVAGGLGIKGKNVGDFVKGYRELLGNREGKEVSSAKVGRACANVMTNILIDRGEMKEEFARWIAGKVAAACCNDVNDLLHYANANYLYGTSGEDVDSGVEIDKDLEDEAKFAEKLKEGLDPNELKIYQALYALKFCPDEVLEDIGFEFKVLCCRGKEVCYKDAIQELEEEKYETGTEETIIINEGLESNDVITGTNDEKKNGDKENEVIGEDSINETDNEEEDYQEGTGVGCMYNEDCIEAAKELLPDKIKEAIGFYHALMWSQFRDREDYWDGKDALKKKNLERLGFINWVFPEGCRIEGYESYALNEGVGMLEGNPASWLFVALLAGNLDLLTQGHFSIKQRGEGAPSIEGLLGLYRYKKENGGGVEGILKEGCAKYAASMLKTTKLKYENLAEYEGDKILKLNEEESISDEWGIGVEQLRNAFLDKNWLLRTLRPRELSEEEKMDTRYMLRAVTLYWINNIYGKGNLDLDERSGLREIKEEIKDEERILCCYLLTLYEWFLEEAYGDEDVMGLEIGEVYDEVDEGEIKDIIEEEEEDNGEL